MASSISNVHRTRSLVNNYEISLLETSHWSMEPSKDRLQKSFKIFDEIIPTLGQYQRVMKLIRDNIYEAVFSREYTVAVESDQLGTDSETGIEKRASIERVPHFVILNNMIDERNKRAEDAEQKVEKLEVVIEELNVEIKQLNEQIDSLEVDIETQKKQIENLKADVINREQKNSRLTKELQARQQDMITRTKTLEYSLETVNGELALEKNKVLELTRFKKCHDNVQDNFVDPSAFSMNPQRAFSAKEQKLRKDITEGKTLEKQLLKLKNTCIDEFDEYLEKQTLEERENFRANRERGQKMRNGISFEEQKTEDRQRREASFTNMIANIEDELKQNELHLSILESELEKLNEIKREPQTKAKIVQSSECPRELRKHVRWSKSVEEDESDILDIIKNVSINHHYLPQEPVLNKYAITAFYSSNQGNTFYEFQNVHYCKSCGQKTLVCPHKVSTGERTFHLPLHCTHIKFTRPGLPISEITKKCTSVEKAPSVSSLLLQCKKAYARLWEDLASREHCSTRQIPRVMKENRLLSLIKQFYASIVLDDCSDDEDGLVPLSELWFSFFTDRYQVESVAFSIAKDVAEAIARTVHLNRFIQLFADCMCGILDPSAFRYYLILSCLVQSIQWTSMADFSCFVKIVYPFMNADDLEQFAMTYTSFSENKISGALICEFLLYIILKQREPSFHELEIKLLSYPGTNAGSMNEVVFFEAMAEIFPLSSERLCHRLFAQSKADTKTNSISITRLSQIGSYLDMHQRNAVMEIEITEKLQATNICIEMSPDGGS